MLTKPKAVFPEISSAAEFNQTATAKNWPMICDETLQFQASMLTELLNLWQEQAGDGIPERNALTARKLQPFIRNISIFERIGDGLKRRYRVRLMGSGIVQYYGELTGKHFDESIPGKFQDRWYAFCDVPLLTQKPMRFILRADTFEKSYMTVEYLCAPLKMEGGAIKSALTGVVFSGLRPWSDIEAEERKRLGLDAPA
jgi:hypothetical protein